MSSPFRFGSWLPAQRSRFGRFFDRMLVPSVRWFVRRRLNRVIDDLNARLQFQIPRFASTRRQVLIDRLTYDPEVLETVDRQASASGTPRDVLIAEAARYAREIVPSFNAYAYFRIGHYVARGIIRFLYRVRLGSANEQALSAIDPTSSIVFRDQPPQQHGLPNSGLHGRESFCVELRSWRMGADLAAPDADPDSRRVFRASRLRKCPVPQGSRPLRPICDRGAVWRRRCFRKAG